MKFKYLKFPLPKRSEFLGNIILKPVIPIKILRGNNIVSYAALIDSGADICIFHSDVGKYLGLDISSGIRAEFGGVQGIGGSEAFLHKAMLNIGGWDYETAIGFSDDIAEHSFGILGQKGFFDIFVVKFDLVKEEIELKERK